MFTQRDDHLVESCFIVLPKFILNGDDVRRLEDLLEAERVRLPRMVRFLRHRHAGY